MKTRTVLIADGGKLLTDGVHFGRVVYLPPEEDGSLWQEVDESAYREEETDGGASAES